MSQAATPVEWRDTQISIPTSPIIRQMQDVSGVDEILESAAALAAGNFPVVDDVIPMSELEIPPHISSSLVEFFGLSNLERPELDGFDSIPPPAQEPAPFSATPSEDAAVAEDPFGERAI